MDILRAYYKEQEEEKEIRSKESRLRHSQQVS